MNSAAIAGLNEPAVKILTLSQSVALGLENDTRIILHQSNVYRAELEHEVYNKRYAADYLLNVNLNWASVDIEAETLQSIDENANTQTLEFKVLFPWWHKASFKQEAVQKRIDIELQKNQLHEIEKKTEMAIYRSYFGVVMQQAQLEIAKRHQIVAKTRQLSVLEQLNLGRSSTRDAITENSNVINHNLNVEIRALELLDMQEDLLALLGLSMEEAAPNRLILSNVLNPPPFDVNQLDINDAITEKLLDMDLKQARQRIAVELTKASWTPKLSAQIAYTPKVNSVGTSQAEYDNLFNYGISLQLPFPKQGVSRSKMRLENHYLNELLLKREQKQTAVVRQVAQLKRKMSRVERKIVLLNQLILEKKKEVVSVRASFSIGKISNLELQLVESVMMDSESSLYDTLYDYTLLKGELLQLHGHSVLDPLAQSYLYEK